MPRVDRIRLPALAEMGVAVEGSERWWPQAAEAASLPAFGRLHQQVRAIEVFNRGRAPFSYRPRSGAPWLHVGPPQSARGTGH